MNFYAVIENGEAYSLAYTSYEKAVEAVKERYKVWLEDPDYLAIVDVDENKQSGRTSLYIEKGIYIDIYKLQVV